MGLIKATVESIRGELKDQFLKPIRLDDMGNNLLMKKVTTENGVIPNGSRIIVAPGQVAALYDNGKIVDATAEAGEYQFKTDASPSFFGGDFGPVFKDMWERFKYGGGIAKEQAVFFFNMKEIIDNKFGTQNPIPYKDWGHPLTNPRTNTLMAMSVEIKCFGRYSFKIIDPAKFMMEIAGSNDEYTKDNIVEQLRAEVIGVFQNVTNSLGEDDKKISALSLPSQTDEIRELMDDQVFDEPIRNRGLKLVTFIVESVTLTEESKDKIDKYEFGSDAYQQKATITEAYANAVQNAASNDAGAFNGFFGLGVANMGMGNPLNIVENVSMPNTTYDSKSAEPVVAKPEVKEQEKQEWTCECGQVNHGNFCMKCGKKKVQNKICPKCNEEVGENAKFCPNCGNQL